MLEIEFLSKTLPDNDADECQAKVLMLMDVGNVRSCDSVIDAKWLFLLEHLR